MQPLLAPKMPPGFEFLLDPQPEERPGADQILIERAEHAATFAVRLARYQGLTFGGKGFFGLVPPPAADPRAKESTLKHQPHLNVYRTASVPTWAYERLAQITTPRDKTAPFKRAEGLSMHGLPTSGEYEDSLMEEYYWKTEPRRRDRDKFTAPQGGELGNVLFESADPVEARQPARRFTVVRPRSSVYVREATGEVRPVWFTPTHWRDDGSDRNVFDVDETKKYAAFMNPDSKSVDALEQYLFEKNGLSWKAHLPVFFESVDKTLRLWVNAKYHPTRRVKLANGEYETVRDTRDPNLSEDERMTASKHRKSAVPSASTSARVAHNIIRENIKWTNVWTGSETDDAELLKIVNVRLRLQGTLDNPYRRLPAFTGVAPFMFVPSKDTIVFPVSMPTVLEPLERVISVQHDDIERRISMRNAEVENLIHEYETDPRTIAAREALREGLLLRPFKQFSGYGLREPAPAEDVSLYRYGRVPNVPATANQVALIDGQLKRKFEHEHELEVIDARALWDARTVGEVEVYASHPEARERQFKKSIFYPHAPRVTKEIVVIRRVKDKAEKGGELSDSDVFRHVKDEEYNLHHDGDDMPEGQEHLEKFGMKQTTRMPDYDAEVKAREEFFGIVRVNPKSLAADPVVRAKGGRILVTFMGEQASELTPADTTPKAWTKRLEREGKRLDDADTDTEIVVRDCIGEDALREPLPRTIPGGWFVVVRFNDGKTSCHRLADPGEFGVPPDAAETQFDALRKKSIQQAGANARKRGGGVKEAERRIEEAFDSVNFFVWTPTVIHTAISDLDEVDETVASHDVA